MFRWRITDFEDKGNYWDLPAEDIKLFQILKGSKELEIKDIEIISKKIREFNNLLYIKADKKIKEITNEKIAATERSIFNRFKGNLSNIINKQAINLNSNEGNQILIKDIKLYMKSIGLDSIEEKTTTEIVLNPNSEWIKGIKIILAELGIVSYRNKILRQKEIFNNVGGTGKIINYIINRIAYLKAYFKLLNIDEVILFRGMSTDGNWMNCYEKSLTSWTFNLDVALSFADLNKSSNSKNGYILKRTVPIENIFMTFLETESMNKQYKECEAILFFNNENGYY